MSLLLPSIWLREATPTSPNASLPASVSDSMTWRPSASALLAHELALLEPAQDAAQVPGIQVEFPGENRGGGAAWWASS